MFLLALVLLFLLTGAVHQAEAFEVGVQDQGADPATLKRVADDMGARTVRMVVRTQDPQVEMVERYRALGFNVQAAIVVKRDTTPRDIARTVNSWRGAVHTVSIGNEPELNGVPACTYARLFAVTSRALRKVRMRVGFGEFGPARAFEYIRDLSRCHVRVRADFTAVHPYQFFSDPLGAPTERSGVGTWLGLGNLGRFKRRLRDAHLPIRLRATEFSYLVDGRYKVTMGRAATMLPRAVKQARKHVEQLILYGLGCVPAGTWGSAPLLDCDGRRTPAYLSLARALGRVLGPEHEPLTPSTGLLPDGATERLPDVPLVGVGAAVEKPTEVVIDPVVPSEPTIPPEPIPLDVPVDPAPATSTTEVIDDPR